MMKVDSGSVSQNITNESNLLIIVCYDAVGGCDDEGRWWITFAQLNLLPVKH